MSHADLTAALKRHLEAAIALREEIARDPLRRARRHALREWQAARLARTYADLARSEQYRNATRFFLSDLYTTRDLSARDRELARALPAMVRLAPAAALEPLELAFELDAVTESLDADLAAHLPEAAPPATQITDADYAAAYRASADRPARERQIALLIAVGQALDKVAHGRVLAVAVAMMRGPAHAAGFGELQEFLERGLAAFRSMRSARTFLDIVRSRELAILDRLFDGAPEPFAQT